MVRIQDSHSSLPLQILILNIIATPRRLLNTIVTPLQIQLSHRPVPHHRLHYDSPRTADFYNDRLVTAEARYKDCTTSNPRPVQSQSSPKPPHLTQSYLTKGNLTQISSLPGLRTAQIYLLKGMRTQIYLLKGFLPQIFSMRGILTQSYLSKEVRTQIYLSKEIRTQIYQLKGRLTQIYLLKGMQTQIYLLKGHTVYRTTLFVAIALTLGGALQ